MKAIRSPTITRTSPKSPRNWRPATAIRTASKRQTHPSNLLYLYIYTLWLLPFSVIRCGCCCCSLSLRTERMLSTRWDSLEVLRKHKLHSALHVRLRPKSNPHSTKPIICAPIRRYSLLLTHNTHPFFVCCTFTHQFENTKPKLNRITSQPHNERSHSRIEKHHNHLHPFNACNKPIGFERRTFPGHNRSFP